MGCGKYTLVCINKTMRDNGRHILLLKTFEGKSCTICGDAEIHHLVHYPHHKKVKSLVLRNGKKTKALAEAIQLIERCTPICVLCLKDRYYSTLMKEEPDPRWSHQNFG